MDGLLKLESIKTTSESDGADLKLATPAVKPEQRNLEGAEDALKALQSQPDFDTLTEILEWLCKDTGTFDIRIPSPRATQIANALARDVLPNYWRVIREAKDGARSTKKRFVGCLRNVVGIGSLVIRLRDLVESPAADKHTANIQDTLEVLEASLRGTDTVGSIAGDLFDLIDKPAGSLTTWQNFVPYLAGSKVLNTAASAELKLRDLDRSGKESWLSDGPTYARWLGRNIKAFDASPGERADEKAKAKARLFSKAWFLGYRRELVQEVFRGSLRGITKEVTKDLAFLQTLKPTELQDVTFLLLQVASNDQNGDHEDKFIGGFGAFLTALCERFDSMPASLAWWIVNDPENRATTDIRTRRAMIAALAGYPETLADACERLLNRFSDKLYIQNTPTLLQEAHGQDLLLIVGRLNHSDEAHIRQVSKSSHYLNAISNRLAASSPRAGFLGMVLGMTVSQMVDPPDKRLKFEDDRLSPKEVGYYTGLVKVIDKVTTLADLEASSRTSPKPKPKPKPPPAQSAAKVVAAPKSTKITLIQEASDSSSEESEDPDLPVYAKPDSDPSDSEDDPTLIDRAAPKAPVYIRDLLRGLRDGENYDRHRLALTTAANLIRRKASFGTEVSEHATQLAAELASSRDTFNMEGFEEHRLRGMIALVAAQPTSMGPWFAASAFTGDYSVAQRAAMLTALALGGRELAGFREEDDPAAATEVASFPSRKRLPARLEAAFASVSLTDATTQPLTSAATRMQATLLRPLAAEAASKAAGPAAVTLRSVTATKGKTSRPSQPVRRVDNKLARLLGESFFSPLVGRLRLELGSAAGATRSPFATPGLAAHALRSLALLLGAAGPAALGLPTLAADLLSLVLWGPVRAVAALHAPVREAVLLCLLAAVDSAANGGGGGGPEAPASAAERVLVHGHASELLEAQAWSEAVFEATPPPAAPDDLDARIRQLAAGVLVRVAEMVQRFRHDMLGDLARFA